MANQDNGAIIESSPSIDKVKDDDTREGFQHILDLGQRNVIELSAAPTAGAPLLEDREVGQYSDDVWFRIGGKLYKQSADEVITIT